MPFELSKMGFEGNLKILRQGTSKRDSCDLFALPAPPPPPFCLLGYVGYNKTKSLEKKDCAVGIQPTRLQGPRFTPPTRVNPLERLAGPKTVKSLPFGPHRGPTMEGWG